MAEQYKKIFEKNKELNKLDVNKLKKIRPQLEYLMLRLLFINPIRLPLMTDSILRKDFNFAMYLSYCYGKVLTNFFRFGLIMLLIMFGSFLVLSITYEVIPGTDIKLYVLASLFVIAVVSIVLIKSCLTSAEKKLTPSIFDETGEIQPPEKFDITMSVGKGSINPFSNYHKLPQMSYIHTKEHITGDILNEAEREQIENE